MNLNFTVLWFDDRGREFFDSLDLEPFEDGVRTWGFVPVVEFVETPEQFMSKAPFKGYDLIVVDYNLGEFTPHGDAFIKRIRDHQIYTDVIFYSAQPSTDLWAAIGAANLEGIYVANRQVILDKLLRVARQSVHKVLDLNNMRGMVMAEVGDIDLLIESILKIGIAGLKADEQNVIFLRFHEEASKQAENARERLAAFKDKPELERMLALCDSDKRFANFNRLKKKHEMLKTVVVGDYVTDVLSPRNCLAHGTPTHTEEGHIFEWQKKKYVFSEAESLSLRKKILAYKSKFQEILEQLSKGSGT